jgi:hypothetical protein
MFDRVTEPEYCEIRRSILAQLGSGRLTEGSDLSKVLDSLEHVELTMEVEESGVEPAGSVPRFRRGPCLQRFEGSAKDPELRLNGYRDH